ncbi:MAG: hypothetical protein IID45_10640, partial [Planctomycetes bacterium]|nr:hypothetical protein [Planctomycetota bacterium]
INRTQPERAGAGAAVTPGNGSRFAPPGRVGVFPAGNIAGNKPNPFAAGAGRSDIAVVHPSGLNALDYYNRGMEHMRHKEDTQAYAAFQSADELSDQLTPYQRRNLDTALRSVAPRRRGNLTLIGAPGQENKLTGSRRKPEGLNPLQLLDKRQRIVYDRLRNETYNAILKADNLREKNPTRALEAIDRAVASIENSTLSKRAIASLLKKLRRSRGNVEAYMKQRAPILALKEENARVKRIIEEEILHKVRIEQEFANLVEDFNRLFKQRRFAEAEVVSKQARQLDPNNPVAMTLFWKARFGRRIASNRQLKEDKEDGFWRQLDAVEQSAIPFSGNPMQFPKNWKELSERRRNKYGPDNRTRTQEEKRIEQSLSRQISLHFKDAPLADIIRHIATVADINVVLDRLGLEDEAVTTNTKVSIDVDGIMLKSTLNLILRPLNLDYTIEDEVLKVTSRMRVQGKLVVATYSVADLVVPIPNFTRPMGAIGMDAEGRGISGFGAMQSIPSYGMGGAQFQVNDLIGQNQGNPFGQGNLQARVNGNSSAIDFDTLSELITQTIEPESWREIGGPGSLKHFETTLSLVIRQTQKVHEEIADLLKQLRRLQDLQVTIEVRFVTVAVVVGIFVISMIAFGSVKQIFFPSSTRPQFYMEVYLPSGTHIRDTERLLARAEEYLMGVDGVTDVATALVPGQTVQAVVSWVSEVRA